MNTGMLKRLTLVSALLLVVSALFMIPACTTTKQTQTASSIESSFRDSYPYKTYLQNDNITMSVKGSKVVIEGSVPDASHMILAEKVANSIAGVKSVDNRIQVEGGRPLKESDAWVGSQVKAELMMHPDVNAARTDIFVNKGVVTLHGQAQNDAQRALTAEYAKNVKGVKQVVNAMTVAGGPAMQPPVTMAPPAAGAVADDAAIEARAETALDNNASTSDLDVALDSTGGVVTVIGTADNQAQKDLVTRIVTDIRGVKAVNNEMTVLERASLY
jgi:hyperosmotically inducible periplasmic protein